MSNPRSCNTALSQGVSTWRSMRKKMTAKEAIKEKAKELGLEITIIESQPGAGTIAFLTKKRPEKDLLADDEGSGVGQ